MGDVPDQVFIDAARASVLAHFPGRPAFAATVKVDVDEPGFRAAVASAYRAGQAGSRDLVGLLGKRIAVLRFEAGEEFCTCESYDCRGECCGIGNCTCTADATPAADGQDGDGRHG